MPSDTPKKHTIEEHLRDEWVDKWIEEGLDAVEAFLRNHAAFDEFTHRREEDTTP